jgi:hypothetical protein
MSVWDLFLWGVATLFLWMTLSMLFHLRWAKRLPALTDVKPRGTRVSAVVAARNEETRIEQTVRRLLAQEGLEMEVIVVDDRSTDDTREILRRLAKEDARVKPLRVDVLPEGWLGKCHACHLGAAQANGEWILFTDADCWLKQDAIVRALNVAERESADHIALTPGVPADGPAVQAWHLAFLLTLANWFSGVNRDRPKAYLGMGAFNLVRTSAYRECGGYEALRLTVLDDVRLGLLLRRAGKRTRGFIGGDDTECHWSPSALGMIRLMEKNYFAAIDYRTVPALTAPAFVFAVWGAAIVGPFTGTAAGWGAICGMFSLALPAGKVASRLGWSRAVALLTPLIFPMLFYAMLNSAVVTLRAGGIRWRETFYPLEALRRSGIR